MKMNNLVFFCIACIFLCSCGLAPESHPAPDPVLPEYLYGDWKMDLSGHLIEDHQLTIGQKNIFYPQGATLLLTLSPDQTYHITRMPDGKSVEKYNGSEAKWKIIPDILTGRPTLLLYAPPNYMPGAYERPTDAKKPDISFLEINTVKNDKDTLILCNGDGDDYACFYPVQ